MPQFFTVEGLATQTGYDRRTVAAALRNVEPDGRAHGRSAWRISTALAALHDRQAGTMRGEDPDADELLRLAIAIERGFERARKIDDITERREFLTEIGQLVGRMDRKLSALDEDDDVGAQIIHEHVLRDMVSQFLGLMGWKLADEGEELRPLEPVEGVGARVPCLHQLYCHEISWDRVLSLSPVETERRLSSSSPISARRGRASPRFGLMLTAGHSHRDRGGRGCRLGIPAGIVVSILVLPAFSSPFFGRPRLPPVSRRPPSNIPAPLPA